MAASPDSPSEPILSAPLHVLHVADTDCFIRFGRMLRHLALALNTEGIHCCLLSDDAAALADLDGTPVECHGCRALAGWPAWRLCDQLERELEPLPAVVHLWGAAALHSVGEWACTRGIPVLAHALGTRDLTHLHPRRLRPGIALATACPGLLRGPGAPAPADAARFVVLPPALLMPESGDELPADHTLGLLWTGRFEPDQGLDTLLEAVSLLHRRGCDLQLVLVGAGPEMRHTWEHARRAGLHACVTLIDEPRAWDRALAGVDACVVPACQQQLSLAPLLAMALQRIVIAARDQLAGWFIPDRTVWAFRPGSAEELAAQLSRAADDGPPARALRRSALEHVRRHHAVGQLTARLVALYRELANPPEARGRVPAGHERPVS